MHADWCVELSCSKVFNDILRFLPLIVHVSLSLRLPNIPIAGTALRSWVEHGQKPFLGDGMRDRVLLDLVNTNKKTASDRGLVL